MAPVHPVGGVVDADVEHLEFEHTPGNHRPFMLTAFADGQAVQLWFTEQQISEIWDKAMAPLMAYRAAKSTPFLKKPAVITTSFSPLSIISLLTLLWLVPCALPTGLTICRAGSARFTTRWRCSDGPVWRRKLHVPDVHRYGYARGV